MSDFLPAVLRGGIDVVQLREKNHSDEVRLAQAHIMAPICRDFGVPFIMNDSPELALAVGADGVHVGQDDDSVRQRRASANRVLTILRAGLNQAFRDGKINSDVAWRTVKSFREVDAPRLRYFTKDEVTRLVNAAQGDFRDLVRAALFTGCRYGELTRLRAGDINPDSGTVFVGQSKSGKARHVVLTDEGATPGRRIALHQIRENG